MTVTERTDEALEPTGADASEHHAPVEDALVEDDVLVEEVSIDGMCGVY